MPLLMYLHLQGNHFMGSLPSTLANSSSLLTFDLMHNKFSGRIPRWISSFSSLRVLMLKENKLEGSIPTHLCELKNIRLLDLSQNKLSGGIPYCLNNIGFGNMDAASEIEIGSFIVSWTTRSSHYRFDSITGKVFVLKEKQNVTLCKVQEVDFTTKSRYESYKGSILNFMSGLDLSSNQLRVAHNNLSGMTPDMKNQFATFGSASYEGNLFLCGPPLPQNCSIGGRNRQPHHLDTDDFRDAFLWSFVGAFGVFFISVIIVIYLNPYIFNYKLLVLERVITSYLYE
ncbi:receptor-like protein 9a isoform X3 [Neltuma alba]|uniref:receptor-like protein 9a isoform X3 n=1 Tax=Neltuma alba TaxID=207710 RepID=UPI0010A4E47F|nr:receptor-like protein 9a isoform X3 [Prosopis alba]